MPASAVSSLRLGRSPSPPASNHPRIWCIGQDSRSTVSYGCTCMLCLIFGFVVNCAIVFTYSTLYRPARYFYSHYEIKPYSLVLYHYKHWALSPYRLECHYLYFLYIVTDRSYLPLGYSVTCLSLSLNLLCFIG